MKKFIALMMSVLLVLVSCSLFASAADVDVLRGLVPTLVNNTPGTDSGSCDIKVLTDGNTNWDYAAINNNLWYCSNSGKDGSTICDVFLTWDLSKTVTISKYTVWSNTDQTVATDIVSQSCSVKDFTFETSTDNKTWTVADTVKDNKQFRLSKGLPQPITVKYVRFHITKSCEKLSGFTGDFWPALRLSDIQVYQASASSSSVNSSSPAVTTSNTQVYSSSQTSSENITSSQVTEVSSTEIQSVITDSENPGSTNKGLPFIVYIIGGVIILPAIGTGVFFLSKHISISWH